MLQFSVEKQSLLSEGCKLWRKSLTIKINLRLTRLSNVYQLQMANFTKICWRFFCKYFLEVVHQQKWNNSFQLGTLQKREGLICGSWKFIIRISIFYSRTSAKNDIMRLNMKFWEKSWLLGRKLRNLTFAVGNRKK